MNLKNNDYSGLSASSFKWKILCIDNPVVSEYIIINPSGEIGCSWKGYNHTVECLTEWKIEYLSTASVKVILEKNLNYFKNSRYNLKKSHGIACSWELFDNTLYYSDVSHQKDCLTITLTKEGKYTRVRFYLVRTE